MVAHVNNSNIRHARMGHASAKVLQMLPVQFTNKVLDICDSCFLGKQSRCSFPQKASQRTYLFDLVHTDLWGPYRFKTQDNCNMFLTLVEDKSRTTWVYLLSDKAAVLLLINQFVMLIRTLFHKTIKVLRTDNGTKFCNKGVNSFLQELGIVHQTSCAYFPQQNGLVERKHRHLLDCARLLRFHAALPIIFWGDYILTAAYLINRSPSLVLGGKSPFEMLFNAIPDYNSLRVFGSLCYASVLPKSWDKFDARAVKGVFLGYPYAKKGYKVLN